MPLNNYKIFLNDLEIPQLNAIKHLGHTLKNNTYIFNNESINCDIKLRSNVIMSNFYYLPSNTKIHLFNTYCNTFYGSQLCSLYNTSALDKLDRDWRVCGRKIIGVSPRTHRTILSNILSRFEPSIQIYWRILLFFKNGLSNRSKFISSIFKNCMINKNSIMYRNLIKISNDLKINDLYETLNVSKKIYKDQMWKYRYPVEKWKINIIQELLKCKDAKQLHCNLNIDEISIVLNDLCIN